MAAEHRGLPLSRRCFVQRAGVAGLGLLAGCGRLPGQAEPPARAPRIGTLVSTRDEAEEFREGLRALGYVEGHDVTLDLRSAEGNDDRWPELAADLVHLPVDLIYAVSTPATQAAKQASSAIPIVMVAGGNPVDTGLVASLAHPGGNVTGVSFLDRPLEGKRLELLKEAVPSIARVAVVWGQTNPALNLTWADLQGDAPALGLTLESVRVRAPEELPSALASAARAGVDAVLTLADNVVNARRPLLVEFAATHELPAMYHLRAFVSEGGLMSYAPDSREYSRRAAIYVDRILKGAKPADLPVEQPTRFEFVLNLRTAQALGLTIPQHVLLQATEVIR